MDRSTHSLNLIWKTIRKLFSNRQQLVGLKFPISSSIEDNASASIKLGSPFLIKRKAKLSNPMK